MAVKESRAMERTGSMGQKIYEERREGNVEACERGIARNDSCEKAPKTGKRLTEGNKGNEGGSVEAICNCPAARASLEGEPGVRRGVWGRPAWGCRVPGQRGRL